MPKHHKMQSPPLRTAKELLPHMVDESADMLRPMFNRVKFDLKSDIIKTVRAERG